MNPELNSRVETRDVHRRSVVIAVVSFLVLLVIGAVSAWVFYRQQIRAQLSTAAAYSTSVFPLPRLQASPPELLAALHSNEDKVLTTYAWKDDRHQFARLPINRVLELAAKKNLIPSQRSQTDAP